MSPRTLTIDFPDGAPEHRFTDVVFVVGDTIHRQGKTWIVTLVSETNSCGAHTHMTVRDGRDSPSDGGETYFVTSP
jgi:hypothetical protein